MPDAVLQERSPLHGPAVPGRFGARGNVVGVSIEERTMALASVVARRDQRDALGRKVAERYGLQLPDGPRRSTAGSVTFAGVAPGQWVASTEGAADFVTGVRSDLGSLAAVADQSDSRLVVRLSGPRVRDVLVKGLAVDLHPRAFKLGDVAVTLVAHIGVQIDMLDDAPTYQLAAARSMAGSFWSWLTASAAEFGYDVVTK